MSNLYKQRITSQEGSMRIINSNEIIEQKLSQLQKTFRAQQMNVQHPEGFQAGLEVSQLDIEQYEMPEPDYVKEAKEEAERILSDARAQAERILSDAGDRADDISSQARADGHRQGYEEGTMLARQELEQAEQELEAWKAKLATEHQERLAQMEPQLLDTILQVVDNVFQIQFSQKKEILLHLIHKTLKGIKNCREFQLRAGRDNYLFLETHKNEIMDAVGEDIALTVVEDASIEDDCCMIETDSGMYDCSIDVELKNLIRDIRSLCS